ncbi:MAG: lysophospholipid acyltransferase family protein, partial [Actinomycetaceae bacterium]|nr:lysophospholipid acyltransferase family protein [Actinomycetaceae bacterium]
MAQKFTTLYRVAASLVKLPLTLTANRRWEGQEHLPKEGPFIAVANHVAELDSLSFMLFLVESGFPARVLAKDVLFKVPILGWAMKHTGQIPVYRRSGNARDSLSGGRQALSEGACIAIFPEGTLTRDPDMWPMKGRTGAARLAMATHVPVIPIAQWGAHLVKPPYKGKWSLFPRKTVSVKAGPAVDLSAYYDRLDEAEAVEEATAKIMEAITQLLQTMRDEVPTRKPWDLKVDGDPYKDKRLPDGRARRWWRKTPKAPLEAPLEAP